MSDTASENKTAGKTREQAGQVARTSAEPARRAGGAAAPSYATLSTEMGTTHISDAVVAKIVGMATREIPGVHSMGRGLARRLGRVRAMVPGQAETSLVSQGVGVE